jgi:hypothetical protein
MYTPEMASASLWPTFEYLIAFFASQFVFFLCDFFPPFFDLVANGFVGRAVTGLVFAAAVLDVFAGTTAGELCLRVADQTACD